jgi:large subunit ribosomal protein L9
MKVILNQDIINLGEEGDIKEVARGHARNFLLPKGLVLPYSKKNIKDLENRKEAIEVRKEDKRKHALSLKERIESETLELTMSVGESGKLFGSVTNAAIAEELEKKDIIIERKRIEVPEHTIKMSGTYKIRIRLYENEEAFLTVIVNKTDD